MIGKGYSNEWWMTVVALELIVDVGYNGWLRLVVTDGCRWLQYWMVDGGYTMLHYFMVDDNLPKR